MVTIQWSYSVFYFCRLKEIIEGDDADVLQRALSLQKFSADYLSEVLHFTLKLQPVSVKKVELLLKAGASPLYLTDGNKNLLQHEVETRGSLEVIKALLKGCKDKEVAMLVDHEDSSRKTCLHYCVENSHLECMRHIYMHRLQIKPHLNVLEFLLQDHTKTDVAIWHRVKTPLLHAAQQQTDETFFSVANIFLEGVNHYPNNVGDWRFLEDRFGSYTWRGDPLFTDKSEDGQFDDRNDEQDINHDGSISNNYDVIGNQLEDDEENDDDGENNNDTDGEGDADDEDDGGDNSEDSHGSSAGSVKSPEEQKPTEFLSDECAIELHNDQLKDHSHSCSSMKCNTQQEVQSKQIDTAKDISVQNEATLEDNNDTQIKKPELSVKYILLNSIFREAVENGHVISARTFLEMGADVNYLPHYYCVYALSTPAESACRTRNTEMIKLLMMYNCDMDVSGFSSMVCPLGDAVFNNDPTMFELLVKYGVDINVGRLDKTPLMQACQQDHYAFARRLVELKANVNIRYERCGASASVLHMAAGKRRSKILEFILSGELSVEFDVDDWCYRCGTPLCVATRLCHHKNVLHLLKHGANPNVIDPVGKTPLVVVMRKCLDDCLGKPKLTIQTLLSLLRYGADVNMESEYFSGDVDSDDDEWENENIELIQGDPELPLDVAVGHRLLPVAQMLWEAGSVPCKNIRWFKHANVYPKHFINTRVEVEGFINNKMTQARSLIGLSRIAVRRAIIQCSPDKLKHLEIPEHLKDYLNFSDFNEIYMTYCSDWGKRCKSYSKYWDWRHNVMQPRVDEALANGVNHLDVQDIPGGQEHLVYDREDGKYTDTVYWKDHEDKKLESFLTINIAGLDSKILHLNQSDSDIEWENMYIKNV